MFRLSAVRNEQYRIIKSNFSFKYCLVLILNEELRIKADNDNNNKLIFNALKLDKTTTK